MGVARLSQPSDRIAEASAIAEWHATLARHPSRVIFATCGTCLPATQTRVQMITRAAVLLFEALFAMKWLCALLKIHMDILARVA
jgi:hypothetical protein